MTGQSIIEWRRRFFRVLGFRSAWIAVEDRARQEAGDDRGKAVAGFWNGDVAVPSGIRVRDRGTFAFRAWLHARDVEGSLSENAGSSRFDKMSRRVRPAVRRCLTVPPRAPATSGPRQSCRSSPRRIARHHAERDASRFRHRKCDPGKCVLRGARPCAARPFSVCRRLCGSGGSRWAIANGEP